MTDKETVLIKKTKVLFMAWGYSIHAKRRIQLFMDDPDFDVAVVSTYDYNFPGARNYLLTYAQDISVSQYRPLLNILKVDKLYNKLSLFLRELSKGIKDINILKRAVTEFNPDVVFLQTLLYPCYLSFFLPKSRPLIITFWNGDVIWWAKQTGIERLLKKQIVTYGVRRAKAITVNSQTALNACLGYGSNADKIHLIRYPGVDLDRFKPLSQEIAREKLGISASKVVLSPRGLGGYLNSDVIVKSAAAVIKKYPDTLFIFVSGVGDSSELEKHHQQARSLGIEQNFKWEGQVSWDLMSLYYNAANVVVSISSNDSLPNTMLEAMSCGVPVIMGDIPQIREWIVDGVNGFLVGPRDFSTLADRIMKCFDNCDQIIDSFIKKNLIIIKNKADSNKNITEIKEVVHQVARPEKITRVS